MDHPSSGEKEHSLTLSSLSLSLFFSLSLSLSLSISLSLSLCLSPSPSQFLPSFSSFMSFISSVSFPFPLFDHLPLFPPMIPHIPPHACIPPRPSPPSLHLIRICNFSPGFMLFFHSLPLFVSSPFLLGPIFPSHTCHFFQSPLPLSLPLSPNKQKQRRNNQKGKGAEINKN